MKKLTDTFGSHFEYLGVDGKTDERIAQNPMFGKSIHVCEEAPTLLDIAKFLRREAPKEQRGIFTNEFDDIFHDGENDIYLRNGEPIMIVTPLTVTFLGSWKNDRDRVMMISAIEYQIDQFGYLHIKHMHSDPDSALHDFVINNHILDKHGVELQRDNIIANIPKNILRNLTQKFNDGKEVQTIQKMMIKYPVLFRLGRLPRYKQSKGTEYYGYHRCSQDFTKCIVYDGRHQQSIHPVEFYDFATLDYGWKGQDFTLNDLVDAIAEEEYEEIRNALIEYCKPNGITKEMVDGIRLAKK